MSTRGEIEGGKNGMTTSQVPTQEQKGSFIRDDNGQIMPLVENFYKFCADRKLMGVKCRKCGVLSCPPRSICPKCYADTFDWIELKGHGKLLTYTIIHFPPSQFQALSPYAVGIVRLEEGPQLSGMIKNVKLEDLRIGLEVQVDFETALPKEWPRWPRYFFKPAS
jgi:uncharacterized OB-fold protein